MESLQLAMQDPRVSFPKGLAGGNAAVEQQRGLGRRKRHIRHQAGLLAQTPQPGLTGAATGREPAQITVTEPAEGFPGLHIRSLEAPLFRLKVLRKLEGFGAQGRSTTSPLTRSRCASASTTGRATPSPAGSIARSRTVTRPSTAVRPPPRRLLATCSTVGP